jgi:hypothetical protein
LCCLVLAGPKQITGFQYLKREQLYNQQLVFSIPVYQHIENSNPH